ncbi:MAG: PPOX class F420-dependent oxidoreductase [Acidimicrobiales bacterium]
MLSERTKSLCEGKNFAALTTLFPGGQPQTQVMWIGCDDEHLLINTEIHRAKFSNTEADPRVSVMIWDAENPYSYVEVRGEVTETVGGQEARDHIDVLAQRYTGADYSPEVQSERVILKVRPTRELVR